MIDLRAGKVADLATDTSIGLDTLVVIEGACPPSPPGGDLLIVNPPPGKCGGTLVGATIEHPEITSWENGDPRMRFLTLDGVHILRANALKPDGATQELIRSQQGPSPPTSPRRRAPGRSSASTWATATGRSRPRSCSSCATSSSRPARTARTESPARRAPVSRCG
jgi:hypothetical protein